ncbi:MAG: gamma-glutamyl-gamma-aminobutyrate hydrolase family protein [Planctomycetota bacterium]|nr:gamma-glutamyl-gamma-aminobutyrate hydrolase family protein [Planctomycetota bacterium]
MPARLPRIGLNLSVLGANKPPLGSASIGLAYLDAVSRAGGLPILLPPLEDVTLGAALLEGLDGICFVGGPDYLPYHYGGRMQKAEELMDERRDRFDCAFARRVLKMTTLPVLGVCGGCQLIAITLNGALIQDIRTEWQAPEGKPLPHAAAERTPSHVDGYRHTLKVERGSLLAKVTGATDGVLESNSYHHQAIKPGAPGDGLRVSAWAPDGIPECIEPAAGSAFEQAGRFVLGVQWHPERMVDDAPQQALFRALVEVAAKKA